MNLNPSASSSSTTDVYEGLIYRGARVAEGENGAAARIRSPVLAVRTSAKCAERVEVLLPRAVRIVLYFNLERRALT